MANIRVVPLGAGQDVGRSCVLVSLGGRNIMFDCGMHMGYQDERRFPDFSYISKSGNFTQLIDCVIISHFHLDHCGALPYFTEICGYDGPVYMTYPTKAICPILLEDMRKIAVEKKGETNFFTAQMIKASMKKVIAVNVHQTIRVDEDLEIKAYYAGHVLGAAMFYVKAGDQSVVYTGDYNMTPDRHLGSAWMDRVKPDLFITETTYATTIRDSKRVRERDFLRNVHESVERGGKVLIPVFALGRAQELCILLDTYWERMNLAHIPIYFSAGMTEKANYYYKLFIHWTNQKIKKTFVKRNMFDFKHIKPFDRVYADSPGPMVLFATPGMLHAGTSLEVFKKWAPHEANMCILPGYCVAGTVGNKILTNTTGPQKIEIDKKTTLEVKCSVKSLSFSAHADAKGIMQLIRQVEPKNVLLVHGERGKMAFLKQKIVRELNINCYDPPNGVSVTIPTAHSVPLNISTQLMKREYERFAASQQQDADSADALKRLRSPFDQTPLKGILVMRDSDAGPVRLLDASEAADEFGLSDHRLTFTSVRVLPVNAQEDVRTKILAALQRWMPSAAASQTSGTIQVGGVSITIDTTQKKLRLEWSYEEEDLAAHVLTAIDRALHISDAAVEIAPMQT